MSNNQNQPQASNNSTDFNYEREMQLELKKLYSFRNKTWKFLIEFDLMDEFQEYHKKESKAKKFKKSVEELETLNFDFPVKKKEVLKTVKATKKEPETDFYNAEVVNFPKIGKKQDYLSPLDDPKDYDTVYFFCKKRGIVLDTGTNMSITKEVKKHCRDNKVRFGMLFSNSQVVYPTKVIADFIKNRIAI